MNGFGRPTIEEMNEIDPTEAVRSEDIEGLLRKHFDLDLEKSYNGSLIHQLFPLLNQNIKAMYPDAYNDLIIALIKFEEFLIST